MSCLRLISNHPHISTRDHLTIDTIFGSGLRSTNFLANLAAVPAFPAFVKTWMALRKAICRCGGWSWQCVKYAASSRLRLTLSGSSCATRRRSSSIDTPSKYSRVDVTVLRHYNKLVCEKNTTQDNGRLTSLASSSDETATKSRDCKTDRNVACASGSLAPDTARRPSDNSART